MNEPFAAPARATLAASRIVPLPTRFRRRVPFEDPVFAVTVNTCAAPDGVTEAIEAPVTPAATSAKSPASTPVTVLVNLTSHVTVAADVGFALDRPIALTIGGVALTPVVVGVVND